MFWRRKQNKRSAEAARVVEELRAKGMLPEAEAGTTARPTWFKGRRAKPGEASSPDSTTVRKRRAKRADALIFEGLCPENETPRDWNVSTWRLERKRQTPRSETGDGG